MFVCVCVCVPLGVCEFVCVRFCGFLCMCMRVLRVRNSAPPLPEWHSFQYKSISLNQTLTNYDLVATLFNLAYHIWRSDQFLKAACFQRFKSNFNKVLWALQRHILYFLGTLNVFSISHDILLRVKPYPSDWRTSQKVAMKKAKPPNHAPSPKEPQCRIINQVFLYVHILSKNNRLCADSCVWRDSPSRGRQCKPTGWRLRDLPT